MVYNIGWLALSYRDDTRVDWRMGGDRPLMTRVCYPYDPAALCMPMALAHQIIGVF